MATPDGVDFLLVTALPAEFLAVQELVDLRLHPKYNFYVGALPEGRVDVGVVEMGTMGSEEAGSFLQRALVNSKPQLPKPPKTVSRHLVGRVSNAANGQQVDWDQLDKAASDRHGIPVSISLTSSAATISEMNLE